MELENIKQNTVWNDAAESINSNFAKIRQVIAFIQSKDGLTEAQLEEYLLANGYTKEEWVLAQNALLEEKIENLEQEGGAVNVEGSEFVNVDEDGTISLEIDPQGGLGQTEQGLGIVDIPSHLLEGINIDVDSSMSDTSENAVANKVIKKYVDEQVNGLEASVNQTFGDVETSIEQLDNAVSELIASKAGAFYIDPTTNLFSVFTTVQARDEYLAGGTEEKNILFQQILQGGGGGGATDTVYSMEVTGIESSYNFTSSSEKMMINAGFTSMVKRANKDTYEPFNESAIFSVEVYKSGSSTSKVVSTGNIVANGGTFSFDLKPYVGNGNNTVIIKAVGLISNAENIVPTTVSVTSLSLTPFGFDWATPFIEGQEYELGGLRILGSLAKRLHIKIWNDEGYVKTYAIPLTASEQFDEIAYTFDNLEHPSNTGVYKVAIWLEATSTGLTTEVLTYNIMCVASEDVNTAKLVCMNEMAVEADNYSDSRLFRYATYNGGSSSATPTITIAKGNEIIAENIYSVGTSQPIDYSYSFALSLNETSANIVASITFGNTQVTDILLNNETSFAPVGGYSFYMDAAARDNGDEHREYFVNEVNGSRIAATWTDMAWVDGMDGWTTDGNGNKCLLLPAMCKTHVDFAPMDNVSTVTLEMYYKVMNASDFNEDVITIAKDFASSWIGMKVKPTNVTLHSQALLTDDLAQGYNTKDEETVHLVITIVSNYEGTGNVAMIYVNGVKKCTFEWSIGDTFAHNGTLELGSDTADLYIYKIRVYNSQFSWAQVLQNYISCQHTTAEKTIVKRREDSVVTNNAIDFDKVYGKYNTFIVELPSGAKLPNRVNNFSNIPIEGTNLHINIVQDPSCSIQGDFMDVPLEGQGTTAMTYYRWNLRSKTDTIRITAKKNVASSMHSHKMGATRLFNDLYQSIVGANETGGRVAVYQYPVYGFLKTEDEVSAGVYHYDFIGLYTIGPDKGDKPTFGYDNETYKSTLIHMEGSDHLPRGVRYDYPWEQMTVGLNEKGDAFLGPMNSLGELAEKPWEIGACGNKKAASDIKAFLDVEYAPAYKLDYECTPMIVGLAAGTSMASVNANVDVFRSQPTDNGFTNADCLIYIDGEYDTYYFNLLSKTYVKDGRKVYDGLSTYGFSTATLASKGSVLEKTLYIREYRRLRHRAEAGKYWLVTDSLFHACFLDLIGATDNEAKNTYPYKFGTLASGSRWRHRQDDLDTMADINNQGSADKKYSIMNTDTKNGVMIYKGNSSYHWRCIRDYYKEEMKDMMKTIMNKMVALCPKEYGTSEIEKVVGCIRHYFWDYAQEYFTRGAYNLDARWTYEDTWKIWKNNSNANAVDPLKQSLGSHYEAEVAWITLRMLFLASMNEWGAFAHYTDSSEGQISFRLGGDFTFNLKPAIDMRPSVVVGADSSLAFADGRVLVGDTANIEIKVGTDGDTMVYVQGADWLQDVGDFSKVRIGSSLGEFSVTTKRLQKLKVGDVNPSEVTTNINELKIGACPSLVEVEARNVDKLAKEVNLTQCPRLRRAYFGGTNLVAVHLAAGSKIENLDLPSSVQRLTLRELPLLTRSGLTYEDLDQLTFLWVEKNKNIDGYDLLKTAFDNNAPLRNIRVIGFDKSGDASDVSLLASLANGNYHGIDQNGQPNNNILPWLEGKIFVNGNIYADDKEVLNKNFPFVIIDALGFYIKFADPEVLRVLLEKGVGDGNGITEGQVKEVTSISTWFANNTSIASFDELVKFIGLTGFTDAAFRGCTTLQSITLPPQISQLSKNMFMGCTSLTNVTTPTPLRVLNSGAFYGCSELESIDTSELEEMKNTDVGGGVFRETSIKEFNAPKLKSLDTLQYTSHFMNTPIEKVVSLGQITSIPSGNANYSLFKNCSNLREVNLPQTLEKIGGHTFRGCSALETCNLPASLNRVEDYAFHGCVALSFEYANLLNVEHLGQFALHEVKIKKLNLEKLATLPSSSTSTQNYGDKSVLEEIDLSSATSLSNNSLRGYSSLKKVHPFKAIVTLGDSSLYTCSSVESLDFADTLTTIQASAMRYCTSLKQIVFRSTTPPTLQYTNALSDTNNCPIFIPAASMPDYAAATNWESYKERLAPIEDYEDGGYVKFADSAVLAICVANWDTNGSGYMSKNECAAVTSIGTKFNSNTEITTFDEFVNFTGVTMLSGDDNATNAQSSGAFYGCSALQSIKMPSSLTEIRGGAFVGTSSLEIDLIVPSLTTVGNNVFKNSGIKRVLNLGSVTNLGTYGTTSWGGEGFFYNCSKLEVAILPVTLASIPAVAFYNCTSLTALVFKSTTPPTLANADALTTTNGCPIYVPDASVSTYKSTTNWNNSSIVDRIKGISSLATDNPTLYAEIQQYL